MNAIIKKMSTAEAEGEEMTLPKEPETSEDALLNNEINDIISHQPHGIIRYGVSVIALISLLLLLVSWFIPIRQTVSANITIVKNGSGVFFGQILMPTPNFKKVAVGETVLIAAENFPPARFGYILGKINRISRPSDADHVFVIHVSLPHGMHTSANKTITFSPGMNAKAHVMKPNIRLLQKLFGIIGD